MSNSIVRYIADSTPNGLRDASILEEQMILSTPYYGGGYYGIQEDNRNDEQLKEIFDKVVGLKGRLPDLQTLTDEVWDHNDDLIHEMAIGYALEEYYQNGIDIESEVTEEILQQDIDNWHASCVQMYSESNMMDEAYEINRYATKNGISYIITNDSDAHEWALNNFEVDTNKDILMNPAQGVMFDDFIGNDGTLFNYGKYAIHYMSRG